MGSPQGGSGEERGAIVIDRLGEVFARASSAYPSDPHSTMKPSASTTQNTVAPPHSPLICRWQTMALSLRKEVHVRPAHFEDSPVARAFRSSARRLSAAQAATTGAMSPSDLA